MQKLTAQQNNVLAFIKCFISKNSFSPTIKEISTNFKFNSLNAAQCHINALIKKGAITATPKTSRSIVVVSGGDSEEELLRSLLNKNDDIVNSNLNDFISTFCHGNNSRLNSFSMGRGYNHADFRCDDRHINYTIVIYRDKFIEWKNSLLAIKVINNET